MSGTEDGTKGHGCHTVRSISTPFTGFGAPKQRPQDKALETRCSLRLAHAIRTMNTDAAPLRDPPKVTFRVLIAGRANAGKTMILQRVCDTTNSPVTYRVAVVDGEETRTEVRPSNDERYLHSQQCTDSSRSYIGGILCYVFDEHYQLCFCSVVSTTLLTS
jgi:hypothetical protein